MRQQVTSATPTRCIQGAVIRLSIFTMLWLTVLQNLLHNHSCKSHLYMYDGTQSTCMEGCSLCHVHTKLFLLPRQPCSETSPWHCCRWYDAGQQLSGQQCLDRCRLPSDCAGAQCVSSAHAVLAASHPGRISSHSSCGSCCPAGAASATAAVTAGLPQAHRTSLSAALLLHASHCIHHVQHVLLHTCCRLSHARDA